MDFWDSLGEEDRIAREAVRSAVVLAKIRYNEQLSVFVANNPTRLSSTLVQTELERIVKECSEEVGADAKTVATRLNEILADVVLPVTQPEKQNVTDLADSPPAKNTTDRPEAQATTDVRDHGAVLVEEITEPDKVISVQGCFACQKNAAVDPSPLCEECEAGILLEAGVTPDFLVSKEAVGYQAQPNPAAGAPQAPQTGTVGPQQPLTPLNPNSPYQCNVCGYTGTFHDVQTHLTQAVDTQHQQAKQQQLQQGGQPQQPMAAVKEADASRYEDDVHKDDARVEPAQQQATPNSHFKSVVQTMANRAAARQLSAPSDTTVNAVATAYGLDPEQVRSSLFITATFGDYAYTNGQPGTQQPPEGYVPLNLDGKQGQESGHEVVVPVIPAVRRTADDLGMDEHTVSASVRDDMGAELSDDYHVQAKGQYTMYVPSQLLDQATAHPQPAPPDQGAPPQGGPPPGGPSGAPGSPVETMQPIQPMQPQSSVLDWTPQGEMSQEYLDWLLNKDEDIQSKRMARRGYVKLR